MSDASARCRYPASHLPPGTGGRWRTFGVALAVALTAGCAPLTRVPHTMPGTPAGVRMDRALSLNGRPLTLHLARVPQSAGLPLVMYTTGDGGWRGKDLAVYRQMLTWGYPLVGISAPEYLKPISQAKTTTTPAALARDYEAILLSARSFLGLPLDTPVVFVGVSRGADLSVVAAAQGLLRRQVAGVVAVGLTREEEFVRRFRRRRVGPGRTVRLATVMQLYEYLPRLGVIPMTVVQSTRDKFLPASEARGLFGADTAWRQFRTIESSDHSFSNARPALYAAMRASMDWLRSRRTVAGWTS